MAAAPVLLGPDSVRMARALADQKARRNAWPYPDCYPPPNAKRIFAWGAIAAPVPTVETVVTSIVNPSNADPGTFVVDRGQQAIINAVVFQFVGPAGMFVPGSGDILWTLDVNTPLLASPLQGSVVQDFFQIPFPLGSVTDGPWPLEKPEEFQASDVLRSKVLTTLAITAGAPQFFISILLGWKWPATDKL